MAFQYIDEEPIAGALGAEVRGVDLSKPLSNAETDEVHQAYLENLVVFFPGQNLSPEALVRVAHLFGVPNEYPFAKGMEGHPKITPLIKNPEDKANFGGGGFHSDTTYLPKPPVATMLYALETPPAGGDTLFANMYQAYDTLSESLKALLPSVKFFR